MKNSLYTIFVSLFLLILNSCLEPTSTSCNLTGINCSCDLLDDPEIPRCVDYEGDEPATAQSNCEEKDGTFSSSQLCPTQYKLGTCKMSVLHQAEYNRYYLDDFSNATSAAAACELLSLQFSVIPGSDYEWISGL